jgi:hypothetical protein
MKRNYEEEPTAIHVLNRREILVLMGATAVATFAGCEGGPFGPYRGLSQAAWSAPHRRKARISWTRSSTAPTSVRTLRTIR